jgi:asparagine synthase (glutamine-hydrolysing)
MVSRSSQFVITYNGEIYNYRQIRDCLCRRHHSFVGTSDTEVLLAAIEEWGLIGALTKVVGMYVFALWDARAQVLYLVRDRMGEKPLYYGWQDDAFLFGSELKALVSQPEWKGTIHRGALELFFRFGYIPAPLSIYTAVKKLPAGSVLALHQPHVQSRTTPEPVTYWSLETVAELGHVNLFRGSEEEAVAEFENVLSRAVEGQMVADVPVGAFLSGGIDSSTVVALMQAQSMQPVRTFTVGFSDSEYNEANRAKEIARYLGTAHNEVFATENETREVIPLIPEIYDEPFADMSQIPTLLVSRLARSSVTVSLSGDGGDELLGGYKRYRLAQQLWRSMRYVPPGLREIMARALLRVPASVTNQLLSAIAPMTARYGGRGKMGHKLRRLAPLLRAEDATVLYQLLVRNHSASSFVVRELRQEPGGLVSSPRTWPKLDDFMQEMMCVDAVTYLPDDILVKLDRAAMYVSLETRVPLLDHRVVEYVLQLPRGMKIRRGNSKWILRQVLKKHVPEQLTRGPKRGFSVPIYKWLRSDLAEWAEDLMSPDSLERQGLVKPFLVSRRWKEHKSGTHNWQHFLWSVLVFQTWLGSQSTPPSTGQISSALRFRT